MDDLQTAIALLRQGDWRGAHALVQEDASPHGCWAHGIVHALEGDLDNARYWYRKAKRTFPGSDLMEAEIRALAEAAGPDGRR